ncbi:MAG: ABC transporter permease [Eubacterium sp.]|nr:ABC transporter permease [Eubacterium sp.]
MIRSNSVRRLFLTPYMFIALFCILIPLFLILRYGFTTPDGKLTWSNIAIIARPEYLRALGLSVLLAAVSTLICLLIAYPLCLLLIEKTRSGKSMFFILFILPLAMNTLLSTMAWQTILEKRGILNQFLQLVHLPPVMIINKPGAIILGMIYNFLPYMILPLYNSLSRIDRQLIESAADLGADSRQILRKVIFPLSVPGIVSGITLVFIPSLTTFVISALLGGNKILLIGNIIDQEFISAYDWHVGSGLSIILMLFIFLNMLLTAVTDRKTKGGGH